VHRQGGGRSGCSLLICFGCMTPLGIRWPKRGYVVPAGLPAEVGDDLGAVEHQILL